MHLRQKYLIAYNSICLVAWIAVGSVVLVGPGGFFSSSGLAPPILWDSVRPCIMLAQTLALAEVLHAAVGIVKANVVSAFLQVVSRLQIVWIIWNLCPPSRTTWGLPGALCAWTAVEVIRYPFYLVSLSPKESPGWLKWLRYSAFIVLYPIGIFSEVRCIWASLDYLKHDEWLRKFPVPMPNRFNFEMDLHLLYLLILLFYVPGAIFLFSHMSSQRARVLAIKEEATKEGKEH